MDEYKYIWLPRWISPQDFIDEHHIEQLIIKNRILVKIPKGMYGLPKAGQLAYIALIKHLQIHGYIHTGFTAGLFEYATRDTIFILVVYDFGLKYKSKNNTFHLIDTPKNKYPGITIDWSGIIFLGIHLDWDYTKRTDTLSMPEYVKKALSKF